MYLYELLAKTDIKAAVSYLRNVMNQTDNMDEDEQLAMYLYFRGILTDIMPVKNDDCVLLGYFLKDSLAETPQTVIDVSLYHISELKKEFEENGGCASSYAFDFIPWEEVLGFQVDKENIKSCGEDAFCAFILEELSFNGITEDDQKERFDELNAAVKVYEDSLLLPEEERMKYFTPVTNIFSDFYEETEEKTRQMQYFDECGRYNKLARAVMLASYLYDGKD